MPPIVSLCDVSGHINSVIGGFTARGVGLPIDGIREFPVLGSAFAKRPFDRRLRPGTSVWIMTGAVVPEGADSTVMQEHIEFDGRTVCIGPEHTPGRNVRAASEDIRKGTRPYPVTRCVGHEG